MVANVMRPGKQGTQTTRFVTLLYHGLGEQRRFGFISPNSFRNQMTWLIDRGFVIEGFDGLARRCATNTWPERYVVVSFDDGHVSILDAIETLQDLGANATLFLATKGCQTDQNYLNARDISRLAKITNIGSHSVTHRMMAQLPPSEVRRELVDSKVWLEEVTAQVITSFSAPSGSLNKCVIELAIETGYSLIGGSAARWNLPSQVAERRIVNRISIDYAHSMDTFVKIVTCDPGYFARRRLRSMLLAAPKAVLYLDRFSTIRGRVVRAWSRLR